METARAVVGDNSAVHYLLASLEVLQHWPTLHLFVPPNGFHSVFVSIVLLNETGIGYLQTDEEYWDGHAHLPTHVVFSSQALGRKVVLSNTHSNMTSYPLSELEYSIDMNFVSPRGIFVAYPSLLFAPLPLVLRNRRPYLMGTGESRFQMERRLRVMGFIVGDHFTADGNPAATPSHACGNHPNCPFTPRCPLDSHCLSFPFSNATLEDHATVDYDIRSHAGVPLGWNLSRRVCDGSCATLVWPTHD